MTGDLRALPWAWLDASLRKSIRGNRRWPVNRADLAAMIDLGLSYQQIATYFAVAPDDVRMLCELYNLFAASSE